MLSCDPAQGLGDGHGLLSPSSSSPLSPAHLTAPNHSVPSDWNVLPGSFCHKKSKYMEILKKKVTCSGKFHDNSPLLYSPFQLENILIHFFTFCPAESVVFAILCDLMDYQGCVVNFLARCLPDTRIGLFAHERFPRSVRLYPQTPLFWQPHREAKKYIYPG